MGDDEDTKVTDQYMRDPHDVMTFYQTNILCEAFTDVNKFYLTDSEMLLEEKITGLYASIEDLLLKEECSTVEKMNKAILGKQSNIRAQLMLVDREPVSARFFLRSINAGGEDKGGSEAKGIDNDDQMVLNYKRENEEVEAEPEAAKPLESEKTRQWGEVTVGKF
jgi:hypothetical protein